MTDAPLPPPDDDAELLAAEYVVGLLDLPTRSAAEARLRRDPGFAAMVSAWESRLADLNEDYGPVPAADVFARIEARLFAQAPKPKKRGWLAFITGAASAALAAVALAAFLLLSPADPTMRAVLTAEASPLRYEAVIAGDEMTLTRVAGDAADTTHDHELWIIIGDAAPVSLGVLRGESITIPTPADTAQGHVLAITLETRGGSDTGAPQGPVVAAGPLTEI